MDETTILQCQAFAHGYIDGFHKGFKTSFKTTHDQTYRTFYESGYAEGRIDWDKTLQMEPLQPRRRYRVRYVTTSYQEMQVEAFDPEHACELCIDAKIFDVPSIDERDPQWVIDEVNP